MRRFISAWKWAPATFLTALTVAMAGTPFAVGQSGTWSSTGGGSYSTPSHWLDNTVANGAGNTANFSTVDIADVVQVTLDGGRTLGHLTFGDTNTISTPGIWVVVEGTPGDVITLNNGASKPTITVNPLGTVNVPELGDFSEAFVDVGLAGTNGFTKLGTGVLTLDGNRNTISGVVEVNQGTLRLGSAQAGAPGFLYSNDGTTPIAQTITQFALANGATLENAEPAVIVNNVAVAAGATATFRQNVNGNGSVNNITAPGTGETLNLAIANPINANATTFSVGGNVTGFTTVNISGQGGTSSFLRLLASPTGGPTAFNINSFATSTVNLDGAQLLVRTNSGGNDINIGALSGTATAQLGGGNTGTAVRYHVGALNTNTTFAGPLAMGGTVAVPVGMLFDKVGTGTMTLSGTNSHTTTNNANANFRGGVTRITAGTLALSGPATIPGGIVDGTLGDLYTTIDIRAGATFDVSGTSGTYSTAPLQHVIGTGTIVGNYVHDEGRLRPGDAPMAAAPNSNVTTPTPGTLTFSNGLTFTGAGEIMYDMTLNPGAGNDLIQVNGATTLTGSSTKVTPNFLAGVPTSGTYTILNSTGGFTGTPTGWQVAWPGRGAAPTVFVADNQLRFTAVPVTGGSVNWRGTGGSSWDIETTQNWHNNGTNAVDHYFNGDSVTFADTYGPASTAVSNFTVNLATDVTPTAVTVNSLNNYTFGGAGIITGSASFTKQGSSTVIMQKANTFSGPATIQAGTVDIGTFTGALGTGNLTMSGGSLVVANTVGGGLSNSGLTVAASTSSTISANGAPAGGANTNPVALPGMSGSGNLRVTTAVDGRLVDLGADNAAFSGDLTIGPDTGAGATTMGARFDNAASGIPSGSLTLESGVTLNARAQAAATVELGALEGQIGSTLSGFAGGGTSPQAKTWQIGALGTDTTFAGNIVDGGNASGSSATLITKVGTGTLALTGTGNTYTGNTTVEAGTLSLASAFLNDGADVFLSTGATLDLDFVGTPDTIDSLFFNGVSQQTGTWGRLNHPTANFTSEFFAGDGLLQVTTFVPSEILIGDYNGDDVVDAADYTVWRNNLGGLGSSLLNRDPDNGAGVVSTDDYASWKANYGQTLPGAGSGGLTAVPEPTSVALLALALGMLAAGRSRGGRG